MKRFRLFNFYFSGFWLWTLLVACSDTQSTPLPTTTVANIVTVALPAATPPVITLPAVLVNNPTPLLPATSPTSQPANPATPNSITVLATATTSPVSPNPLITVQAALTSLNTSTSLQIKVEQQGELVTGAARQTLTATGEGVWRQPQFRLNLSLQVNGQSRRVELYNGGNQYFERTVETVVWRKFEPPLLAPVPPATILANSGTLYAGLEDLNGALSPKYSWTFPTTDILPGKSNPAGYGAMSLTGIYQAFKTDTGTATATLWLYPASNLPRRYQVKATFKTAESQFNYTATYDYASYNDPALKVEVPGDLPK